MEAALRDEPSAFRPRELVGEVKPQVSSWRPAAWVSLAAMLAVVVGLIAWQRFSTRPGAPTGSFTRIAVLPMKDLSSSPTPYLADALTDQLIATLGQIQSLRVTAAGSAAKFKNSTAPDDEIARQLGVDALVQTSVTSEQTSPDALLRARVDTRVVKAGVAGPVWTGSVEWVAGDTHALEAGLSREIARAVNVIVTSDERNRLDAPRQTNPNAEEAYLRGRAELMTYGPDAARRALQAFERAVSFDPRHAGAHAGASRALRSSRSVWSDFGGECPPVGACGRAHGVGTGRRSRRSPSGPRRSELLLRLGLGGRGAGVCQDSRIESQLLTGADSLLRVACDAAKVPGVAQTIGSSSQPGSSVDASDRLKYRRAAVCAQVLRTRKGSFRKRSCSNPNRRGSI